MTFDAPSAEVCTMRRIRTNTPLQALVTLNDPLAIEAAQYLAARVLRESEVDFAHRAARAFELCLARPPTSDETERLHKLYLEAEQKLERDERASGASERRPDHLPGRQGSHYPARLPQAAGRVAFTPLATYSRMEAEDFDDSAWQRGSGMFGHIKPKRRGIRRGRRRRRGESDYNKLEARTLWGSRRSGWEFEVPGPGFESFQVGARFRGSFGFGLTACRRDLQTGLRTRGSEDFSGSREAIRPGRNVMAVAARRTVEAEGDQYIDVSLTAVGPPKYEANRDDDRERAAWVMVAHVLLNLDETLTKR
jgi:hypothetical protein